MHNNLGIINKLKKKKFKKIYFSFFFYVEILITSKKKQLFIVFENNHKIIWDNEFQEIDILFERFTLCDNNSYSVAINYIREKSSLFEQSGGLVYRRYLCNGNVAILYVRNHTACLKLQ